MATSIHTDTIHETTSPISGSRPSTWNTPGELAKPVVRSNSPMLDLVCGSGRIFVPMKYVSVAQISQPSSAATAPTTKADKLQVRENPTPAATLEITTAASACAVAW